MGLGAGDHGIDVGEAGNRRGNDAGDGGDRGGVGGEEAAHELEGLGAGEGGEGSGLATGGRVTGGGDGGLTGFERDRGADAANQHVIVVGGIHDQHRLGAEDEAAGVVGAGAVDEEVAQDLEVVQVGGGVVVDDRVAGGGEAVGEALDGGGVGVDDDLGVLLAREEPVDRGIEDLHQVLGSAGSIGAAPGEDGAASGDGGVAGVGGGCLRLIGPFWSKFPRTSRMRSGS